MLKKFGAWKIIRPVRLNTIGRMFNVEFPRDLLRLDALAGKPEHVIEFRMDRKPAHNTHRLLNIRRAFIALDLRPLVLVIHALDTDL